jgi:hypothetical protein
VQHLTSATPHQRNTSLVQHLTSATPHYTYFTSPAAQLCRCAAVGLTQRKNQIEMEC